LLGHESFSPFPFEKMPSLGCFPFLFAAIPESLLARGRRQQRQRSGKTASNVPKPLYASGPRQVQRKLETHSLQPQGKRILTLRADAADQAKKNRTRLAIGIVGFPVKKGHLEDPKALFLE
jgi:hypothetical protein